MTIVIPALVLLLVVCWPLALVALVAYPRRCSGSFDLPFRIVGVVLEGLVELVRALLFLPARLLGGRARA